MGGEGVGRLVGVSQFFHPERGSAVERVGCHTKLIRVAIQTEQKVLLCGFKMGVLFAFF